MFKSLIYRRICLRHCSLLGDLIVKMRADIIGLRRGSRFGSDAGDGEYRHGIVSRLLIVGITPPKPVFSCDGSSASETPQFKIEICSPGEEGEIAERAQGYRRMYSIEISSQKDERDGASRARACRSSMRSNRRRSRSLLKLKTRSFQVCDNFWRSGIEIFGNFHKSRQNNLNRAKRAARKGRTLLLPICNYFDEEVYEKFPCPNRLLPTKVIYANRPPNHPR